MSDAFKQLSDAMAETVANVTPSLVTVDGRRRLPATGIIHSPDGYIVTAHHIVERDEAIRVMTHDGTWHDATLVGRDPNNDLAVLKVDASDLPAANWGDNDGLRVGNLVLALGKPGQQTQATLGVVSALVDSGARRKRAEKMAERGGGKRRARRRMERMGQMLADGFIQTDVVMYPGFSGGPLVSGDGALHGVNTSGFRGGVSITVPVTTIVNTFDTLRAHGKMRQGYLGIGVQSVRVPASAGLEQATGLLVVSVEPNSPADSAGVLVGDIVVALDGETVEQLDELMALLTGERVGQPSDLDIVRGGTAQTLSVTIAERK